MVMIPCPFGELTVVTNSLIGLGVVMLVTSYLYQRFRGIIAGADE